MATEPRLGTKIMRARQRKLWTQQQLADAVGVDVKTVRNWEKGRVGGIRNRTPKIEEVLGVSLDPGEPEPELLSADLRALIYREFSPEDAALAIGVLERTLNHRSGTNAPGEEKASGQTL